MEVKAINGVSQLGFEGSHRKSKKSHDKEMMSYPQIDSPASKVSSQAMKALLYGSMGLAGLGAMTSCNKEDFGISAKSIAGANAVANAWSCYKPCCPKSDTVHIVVHDTITNTDTIVVKEIVPVPVKDAPWNICDSLIAQGINIGIPLDGPIPTDKDNHVLFMGSVAYNEYDYKLYTTQLDSIGTNAEELSLVTRIDDYYEGKDNVKTSYMKTRVVDYPGVGIKLERYVMDGSKVSERDFGKNGMPKSSNPNWKYAGYEIRTNNRDGQTNKSLLYDKYDNLIEGKYIRGNNMGEFLYGRYVYDDNGNMYIDEETGEPERTYFDFSQGKMWSKEVSFEQGWQ